MKSMSYKSAFKRILIFMLVLVLGTVALVIVADPFFQYHKPLPFLHYVIDNQTSQNAGLIKNFDYESVILGSSMTTNFDTDLFEKELGTKTIKLSVNASHPKDIDKMLSLICEEEKEVETVFLGVDVHNYTAEEGVTAYPYPEYLYDNNLLNDCAYWFNMDVVFDYIIKPQKQRNSTKLNEIYWSWTYRTYGRDVIEGSYSKPEVMGEAVPVDAYISKTENNLENYIIPYIESMSDTQFVIFYPPYSILYWYNHWAGGDVEALLCQTEYITKRLLDYPNVRVFQFQNLYDYITDYDNYCDYTHYRHEMNDYMMTCFGTGENELTKENYEDVFEDMKKWLTSFDYESCW